MNNTPLLMLSCVLFCGCAAQPIYVPLPPTHPASPWALESPVQAQSATLAVNQADRVPPNPDWQIPGMRDDEIHGHAAGQPSSMDMMGHGHMMGGEHGAGAQGPSGHGPSEHPPGMVKMSAPKHKVDYAPEGAVHPAGKEPKEHEPERHLDHTDPKRRDAGFKAAPLAPPMKHGEKDQEQQGHEGHQMPATAKPDTDTDGKPPTKEDSAPVDHDAMGHSEHNEPSDATQEEKSDPSETPAPVMDHSNHG